MNLQAPGPEAAKQISSIAPLLPFIFITGYDRKGALAKIKIPQDFQLLHKPVNYDYLCDVVRKAMQANDSLYCE